jgi:hypothetical protein
MQAIITKYLGPTKARPSRIKATAWRCSVTVPYSHEISPVANYRAAAEALRNKFSREDRNVWRIIAFAEMPDESQDYVFIIDWTRVP